jgi:hypothetical protein
VLESLDRLKRDADNNDDGRTAMAMWLVSGVFGHDGVMATIPR